MIKKIETIEQATDYAKGIEPFNSKVKTVSHHPEKIIHIDDRSIFEKARDFIFRKEYTRSITEVDRYDVFFDVYDFKPNTYICWRKRSDNIRCYDKDTSRLPVFEDDTYDLRILKVNDIIKTDNHGCFALLSNGEIEKITPFNVQIIQKNNIIRDKWIRGWRIGSWFVLGRVNDD